MVTAKCLAVLYLLITLPTSTPMGPAPVSLPARTRAMRGARSFSVAASRSCALAGAVGGQDRVAAGDQPLAGEVIGGDLGEVLLIEEAELERAVVGHQLADGGGAQRGDPPVGVRPLRPVFLLVQGLDPGAGDHAPVADHDHLGQPELLPHHVRDGGERAGVAGVAGEHPDRDRAACRVGEQPVLDLQRFLSCRPGSSRGRPAGSASLPSTRTTGRTAPSSTG